MQTKEMIALNETRRKQLTNENLKYYEDMLLYIRTSDVKEHAGEELLLELLEHTIEAQAHGKAVKEVFGETPQAYCNEMIKNLPRESIFDLFTTYVVPALSSLSFGLLMIGIIQGIREGFFHAAAFPLTTLLVILLSTAFICYGVLKFIRLTVYQKASKSRMVFYAGLLFFGLACIVCICVFFSSLMDEVKVPPVVSLILASLLYSTSIYSRRKQNLL